MAAGDCRRPANRRLPVPSNFWRQQLMTKKPVVGVLFSAAALWAAGQAAREWTIHDRSRPMSRVVVPGDCSTQERAGAAPSDAVVLFDGKDLSKWKAADGGPAKWKVGDG